MRSKVSVCVSEGRVELRSSKCSVEISILVETSLSVRLEAIVLGSVSETILVEAPRSIVRSIEDIIGVVEVSRSIVRSIEGIEVVEVSRSFVRSIEGIIGVVEAPRSIVRSNEGTRVDEVSRSIVRSVEGTGVVKVDVTLRTVRIEAIVLRSISEAVLVEVSSLGTNIGPVEGSCIVLRPKALSPSEHGISLRLSLSVG